jgi:hypothetical protein
MIGLRHSSESVREREAATTDLLAAVLKRIEQLIRRETNTVSEGLRDLPKECAGKTVILPLFWTSG